MMVFGGMGCAVALSCLAIAYVAEAQVLEISPDGSVTRYDGPTQYLTTGARAITPEQPPTARSNAAAPTPTAEIAETIRAASERHQVSERLVEAVAWRESGFNPTAVSPKGARGVMQLMPGTARLLGVDASDPVGNIDGGANYLSQMIRRFGGDTTKALAAYNAGPEAVERYRGVPPYAETIAYVDAILARLGRADSSAGVARTAKTRVDGF